MDLGSDSGGLGGLLPLLLLGGGHHRGISPLLLLLLLGGGFESSSSSSTTTSSSSESGGGAAGYDCASENFGAVLTANVGRRVKLILATTTYFIANETITARVVCVGSDFVVVDRICVNGTPILDPRRLTLRTANIQGVQRITETDRLIDLFCVLD